jgi:hydrogenase nickel incorporation protein HypB
MLINKTDLLPYVDFDIEAAAANARKVNPAIKVLKVSARTGESMGGWLAWIEAARAMVLAGHPLSAAAE